jgi:hypothetical protein
VFPAETMPAVNKWRVALNGRTAMDEADVCAALTGEGGTDLSTCVVVAARDALMEAARTNGWIVADAAPLSIDDLVMMAFSCSARTRFPTTSSTPIRHCGRCISTHEARGRNDMRADRSARMLRSQRRGRCGSRFSAAPATTKSTPARLPHS